MNIDELRMPDICISLWAPDLTILGLSGTYTTY